MATTTDPREGSSYYYGNIGLPDPVATADANPLLRTGLHRLFREAGSVVWTGVSQGRDRSNWDAQIASLGITAVPSFVAGNGVPLATLGDFGQQYTFKDVALMAQSPRDLKVEIDRIVVPLKPRCVPGSSGTAAQRSQDIVSAPIRPAPISFSDTVSLSQVLTSPFARTDSLPSRFTIEGDSSGTVFTNIIVSNGGQSNRLVFVKAPGCDENNIKFILGQRTCGQELCAVQSSTGVASAVSAGSQYQMTLQVWLGPSYLTDEGQALSGSMLANKLFEQTYSFDPSSNVGDFQVPQGQLVAPAGRFIFFVVQPDPRFGAYYDGVGVGHNAWTTEGDGTFAQYYQPWTLLPNSGLSIPVYYSGTLHVDPAASSSTGAGINLAPVTTTIGGAGVDYNASLGALIMSANFPSGTPNVLDQVGTSGTHTTFSSLAGFTNEINVFCVKQGANGWALGDTYIRTGIAGAIAKISASGITIIDPWVSLPGETGAVNSMYVDVTGVFGGDMIAVTSTGGVWRITSDGIPSKMIGLGTALEGAVTIPNLASKYGPWAGKALTSSESTNSIWAIDSHGGSKEYSLGIGLAENILLIPENQNLYIIDRGAGKLMAAAPINFVDKIGDVLISDAGGDIYHVKWTGTQFQTTKLLSSGTQFEQACFSPIGVSNIVAVTGGTAAPTSACTDTRLIEAAPVRLTNSVGDSKHPRMAIDLQDNVWLVFESNRTGSDEIYIARRYGACGKWNTSALGGAETRISFAGQNGKTARSPSVAIDSVGEAHVVWHSDDTDNGNSQVFYSRSVGGGTAFTTPIRLTSGSGNAFCPDVCATLDGGIDRINVVWHDNRFENQYEIMYAFKLGGTWSSSAQGTSDVRITRASGDSLFPRIRGDSDGNLRVVYHDYRLGSDRIGVFLSSFEATTKTWVSSGQGGVDTLITPTGTARSFNPDVVIDASNGVFVVWQDNRAVSGASGQYTVYGSYCAKTAISGASCFPALSTISASGSTTAADSSSSAGTPLVKLDLIVQAVDCASFKPISSTKVSDICLLVKAPGATFFRIANEDGVYGGWTTFVPSTNLDSMIIPWTLSCGNGVKQVCVQVQNSQSVSFPSCIQIDLSAPLPAFSVEFFSDEALTTPLASFNGKPVVPEGDVFIKITSCSALTVAPTFDVITRGQHLIKNQSTSPISASGASGFSGTSGVSANGYTARFHVFRDDGLFHRDGQARIVVHGRDSRGNSF